MYVYVCIEVGGVVVLWGRGGERERERIGYDFHGNDLFYTLYHVNCYISSTTSLKNREENH